MGALKHDLITAAGAALLVAAAVCAELAWLAARGLAALGVICGSAGRPDCPYLIAAGALAVSGAAMLALGLRAPAPLPTRR